MQDEVAVEGEQLQDERQRRDGKRCDGDVKAKKGAAREGGVEGAHCGRWVGGWLGGAVVRRKRKNRKAPDAALHAYAPDIER